jgi:hypothetical protein
MSQEPYLFWVGMRTNPDADPAVLAELSRFYSEVHVPELVAMNPGFIQGWRFKLAAPDIGGYDGPDWLAFYETESLEAAIAAAVRNDGPPEGRPKYTPFPAAWRENIKVRWRMIWKPISSSGVAGDPESIYLVGMNASAVKTEADLAEFNAFYTDIHVPEVMTDGKYYRGRRVELHREHGMPAGEGHPRFCAIYEADSAATEVNRRRRADPNNKRGYRTLGPPVFENHDTLWRLLYERIRF